MFVRHLHTQKAVLEKNDHDGYDKHERIFVNSTVLSVRFLFLSKVQSFLSFDGRCALFFFFLLWQDSAGPSCSKAG